MSLHIGAAKEEIAETVLLPGDPLRAEFLANKLLDNVHRYNNVRGMYGFTGFFQGKRVSIQGTGMGMPSHAIYVHELIHGYDVKQLIRIGSCGAIQPDLGLMDIILATGACTDSSFNDQRFGGHTFAPVADWDILYRAYTNAEKAGIKVHPGNILSTDQFYGPVPDDWKKWAKYKVLAIEMETAALYTLAAENNVAALGILTVSDHLGTGELLSSELREKGFVTMGELALSLA